MNPQSGFGGPHLLPWFLGPFFSVFAFIAIAVYIIPFWVIFKKAGFSPWLSLLTFIPLVGFIVFYVVAFTQWDVVPVARGYPAIPPPGSGYPPRA